MKTALILAAVLAQLGVLAFMAGEREWVVRTGHPILLRTAPIDPMDPMRGAYVRLDYEISHVPRELCRDQLATWVDEAAPYSRARRDEVVYASLHINEVGVAELISLSDQRPSDGLFLRGRVNSLESGHVRVRYGVEALFMEQGAALSFEHEAQREKLGLPVNTEVSVSRRGLGVLTGYRWEPLGIAIVLRLAEPAADETRPERTGGRRPSLLGVTVELKNYSDAPLAIVDRPNGGSLRLISDLRRGSGGYAWVGAGDTPAPARPDDVIVLEPAGTHRFEIDLTDPRWFVVDGSVPEAVPVSLADLTGTWGSWFRIEYSPSVIETAPPLPHASLIRHGALRSRAFSPAGAVD